jgi:predicted porin
LRYILREHSSSTLFVARANYLLSKRTTFYSSLGYMINSANASNAVAAGGSVGMGQNQLGAMVGIQQRF